VFAVYLRVPQNDSKQDNTVKKTRFYESQI